jgi:hypothetical protein
MTVNYVAYMGQPKMTEEWLQGYHQAKRDAEKFIEQQEIYAPYDEQQSQ